MVPAMSRASLAAGADGLLLEVHVEPRKSLCDDRETIDMNELDSILEFYQKINNL